MKQDIKWERVSTLWVSSYNRQSTAQGQRGSISGNSYHESGQLQLMTKLKKRAKAKKKDSQLIIRISSDDRDEFVSLCDELDTSAAREVRRFIRDFVAMRKHEDSQPGK